MRHFRRAPLQVALLAGRVVGLAALCCLVALPGPPLAGRPLLGSALGTAVPVPPVAAATQHDEPATALATEESC